MKRPLGSLKPKHVAISKCFLLHHTGFFSAGFAGEGGCMRAIVLKQGLPLSGRHSVTPAKGSRDTKVSLGRHQALCLSIAMLADNMLVSHGGVRRCSAVDICAVQDLPVWVYGGFYRHGSPWSTLRSQLISYKRLLTSRTKICCLGIFPPKK